MSKEESKNILIFIFVCITFVTLILIYNFGMSHIYDEVRKYREIHKYDYTYVYSKDSKTNSCFVTIRNPFELIGVKQIECTLEVEEKLLK